MLGYKNIYLHEIVQIIIEKNTNTYKKKNNIIPLFDVSNNIVKIKNHYVSKS